jgi:DnaJ-class molecular chaperone
MTEKCPSCEDGYIKGICPQCGGTGDVMEECPDCLGRGEIETTEKEDE